MKIITNRHTIRELIGFRDEYVMLIGIPLIAFLVPILFFGETLENGLVGYLPRLAVSLVYTSAYWFTIRMIFVHSRQKYPNADELWKRLGFITTRFIPAYFLVTLGLGFIQQCLPGMPNFETQASFLDLNVGSLTVTLICGGFYESAYFYARWRESLVVQERLRRQHTESQLEGLKNQVNPHFLFNSLNTLAYIIPEDTDRAVRFVQELSRVYRYILEIRDYRLVTLEQELTFLDAYAYLLDERFGDKLIIEQDIPASIKNWRVIPLALQMLLENAIKHNEISQAHPLHIKIYVEDDRLVVRNSLRLKKQKQSSTQVGLQNIRDRYHFFTSADVQIFKKDTYFQVNLPLLAPLQEPLSSEPSPRVAYPN